MASLASQRTFDNLTNSPVMSWTNEEIQKHINALLAISGAKLL